LAGQNRLMLPHANCLPLWHQDPAGQSSQVFFLSCKKNFPAGQLEQKPAFEPLHCIRTPVVHGPHFSHVLVAMLPNEPSAQVPSHEVAAGALKVLQAQSAHGASSLVALNVPAGQMVHEAVSFCREDPGGQALYRIPNTTLTPSSAVLIVLNPERLNRGPSCGVE